MRKKKWMRVIYFEKKNNGKLFLCISPQDSLPSSKFLENKNYFQGKRMSKYFKWKQWRNPGYALGHGVSIFFMLNLLTHMRPRGNLMCEGRIVDCLTCCSFRREVLNGSPFRLSRWRGVRIAWIAANRYHNVMTSRTNSVDSSLLLRMISSVEQTLKLTPMNVNWPMLHACKILVSGRLRDL